MLYFTSNECSTVQTPDTHLHPTIISERGGNPKTIKFVFTDSQLSTHQINE
jgi:hypothetical protein